MRTVLLLLALFASLASADEALDKALASPGATGLLVLRVVPGSQAEKLGLKAGDILVSLGGEATPDTRALGKGLRAGKKDLRYVRGAAEPVEVTLGAGSIGVQLAKVKKGVPTKMRPAATGVSFDFSRLAKAADERWYVFTIGGKKVGFEHNHLSLADGVLTLKSEVAFDGGERWGVNHFVVTVKATAKPRPTLLSTLGEFPLDKRYSNAGKREGDVWIVTSKSPEGETTTRAKIGDAMMADYLITLLAAFLPRKQAGACWHYTQLEATMGRISLPAALLGAKRESVTVGGKEVAALRVEVRRLGRALRTCWVDDEGRLVRNQYGPRTFSTLSTKEAALAGLSPKIVPQTK